MTQKELSEILHDIGCPVNEGVSSLKNEKVFPRIDYWEIMWEDAMASGDDYENEITWQISFYAKKPRNPKLIELKKRLIEKQQMEQQNQEIYNYMHDIFGAEVVNLFDMKYNPEQK